jgi:hypothetical protein
MSERNFVAPRSGEDLVPLLPGFAMLAYIHTLVRPIGVSFGAMRTAISVSVPEQRFRSLIWSFTSR